VLLRKTYPRLYNNGREYRVRVAFTGNTSAGRNVRLKLSKVVSGVETPIGTEYVVPWSVAQFEPNRVFRVRASASGASPTTLRAKIWTSGQAEPAGWQIEATDADPALQDQGQIQLLTKVTANNAGQPVDFVFDNFEFRDVN
jgi:hypothetical protein